MKPRKRKPGAAALPTVLEVDETEEDPNGLEESKHSQNTVQEDLASFQSSRPIDISDSSSINSTLLFKESQNRKHDLEEVKSNAMRDKENKIKVWSPFTIGTAFP
jgi:hypothetical protein